MGVSKMRLERSKVAQLRFYVFRAISRGERFQFIVCDAEAETGSKPQAKFINERDAEEFAELLRDRYVSDTK